MLGVCHDDPDVTPPEKFRYGACLVVGESVRPEGEVGVQEVGGGEYAVATHRGPYQTLAQTYARLYGEWLPAGGITVDRRGYTHRHGPDVLFDLRVSEETWVGVDGTMRDRKVIESVRFASAAGRAKWAAYGGPVPNFNQTKK